MARVSRYSRAVSTGTLPILSRKLLSSESVFVVGKNKYTHVRAEKRWVFEGMDELEKIGNVSIGRMRKNSNDVH